MKILIISSNASHLNESFPYQVLQEINKQGHQAKIITNFNRESDSEILSYQSKPDNWFDLFVKKIKIICTGIYRRPRVNNKYYFQDIYETVTFTNSKTLLQKVGFKPDIIFLQFNHQFVNAKNLYQLNKLTGAPIFILLMDMAPLTGGCHYAWDCNGYHSKCGNCPGLLSSFENDISYRNNIFRNKYFKKTNIHIIAASNWQVTQLKLSSILKEKPHYLVHSGFNKDIYKPSDKFEARIKLELPLDKKIIFFGAAGITEERKGIIYLLEAIEILSKRGIANSLYLLIAGKASEEFLNSLVIPYKYVGFVKENTLITSYQAADVFACPSIEDSGPTMINQSMLCGTPVVSFKMGVAPDLIFQSESGYIAKLGDSKEFADYLEKVLVNSKAEADKMSENCRKIGLKMCNANIQINEYLSLFKKSITHE